MIGLDIGTTSCKATLFDLKGVILRQAYREYPDSPDGLIDAEVVWQCARGVIMEASGKDPGLAAICVTSFGESVVPVDKNGTVLGKSIAYTDQRAACHWADLDRALGGERIMEITGHVSHPMYTVSRLMWIQKNEPALYEWAEKFLFFASFVVKRLCGESVAENTLAARSMAYDVRRGTWSGEILNAAGIDRSKLGRIVSAGEIVGTVLPSVAEALCLPPGVRVVAGGHDQPCAALGVGAVRGGQAVYGLGTVECLSAVMEEPRITPEMARSHLVCGPHVVPGKFLTYGVLFTGGSVLKWARNLLFKSEYEKNPDGVYQLMLEKLSPAPIELFVLPHFAGSGTPYMNTADKGTVVGLGLDSTREDLVKGVLQGLCYEMRFNIEQMERCGISVEEVVIAGTGAGSAPTVQLRCDMLDRPLWTPRDRQAGTVGSFLIAAVGLSLYSSYEEGVKALSLRDRPFEPREEYRKSHQHCYEKYKTIYPLTAEYYHT